MKNSVLIFNLSHFSFYIFYFSFFVQHYSQAHLKVAATEPEHVVRKAEFDVAVHLLDERLVMIEQTLDTRPDGPAILRTNPSFEIVMASDGIDSPQTGPVDEKIVSVTDAVFGAKPPVFHVPLPAENLSAADAVTAPQPPVCSLESTVLSDCPATADVSPCLAESNAANVSLTDNTESFLPPAPNMENCHLQGELEVIVEDPNGNVKSRQVVPNAITDGFLRYTFYDMMNAGATLNNVLRSHTRTGYNFLSRVAPTNHGIYAMGSDIDIRYETFVPPYVDGRLTALHPDVVFYNVDGSMTETSLVMIPVDQRCYFDHSRRELVVEYVKNTGRGSVKSICVGRSHSASAQMYSVSLAETAVPDHWKATAAGSYLIEHHQTGGTSLWKTVSATAGQYRFNLKSRTVEDFSNSALHTNITAAATVGGIVVGNHLFKAVKQAASGSSYTLRLGYVLNFRTASSVVNKDIVLTARAGATVRTDTHPVMVYRTDTGELEIFVTMSLGQREEDNHYGFNLYKVIVSGLDNPATMETETVNLGFLPYAVSCHDTTGPLYVTGYFDGTSYYLPYNLVVHDPVFGLVANTSAAAFQNGIVISENFKTVSRLFNTRSLNTTPNLIVRADTGLLQCQAALGTIPYIFLSQVVSGTNLPVPSVKEPDDVLRIIYRYKIA